MAGMNVDGRYVLHPCDNPPCVNPRHLRPGSHLENIEDKMIRGRMPRGEKTTQAKLTDAQAAEIRQRRLAGERCKDLAQAFGISRNVVTAIATGKRWRHAGVPQP